MASGRLTARTIRDEDIHALRDAARQAGDTELARTCNRALSRRGGRGDCAKVIAWAREEATWAERFA